jgi:hypothetical protein
LLFPEIKAEAVLVHLPSELRERLERLQAASVLLEEVSDTYLDRMFPGEPVWIACELLVAGIETPAVVALACESPTRLTPREGEPLVRNLLSELAVEHMDIRGAGWIVARYLAREIEGAALDVENGAHLLLGLGHACEEPEEMSPLLSALDDWECTPPQYRDHEQFSTTIRTLAKTILDAAPA